MCIHIYVSVVVCVEKKNGTIKNEFTKIIYRSKKLYCIAKHKSKTYKDNKQKLNCFRCCFYITERTHANIHWRLENYTTQSVKNKQNAGCVQTVKQENNNKNINFLYS